MNTPLRILFVEDSDDDMMMLVYNLQRSYQLTYERVETAESMSDALRRQQWDAIVCDYLLPDFSVFAALSLLQSFGLDLPFIIVSSKIDEETAVDALKAGAHDFVTKGRMARLIPAIERSLSEAESRLKRKQAELALTQREEQLRLALKAANMGTWDWDILTNQITWSKGCEQLFGLASGTYKAFLACVHPEDRESMIQAVEYARESQQNFHHEYRLLSSDGSIHWIESRGKFFYGLQGKAVCMMGTVMDIGERKLTQAALQQAKQELEIKVQQRTAELVEVNQRLQRELSNRKRAEAALQESEGRLAAILENAPAIIYLKDIEGCHLLVNRHFENILHIPRAEILGKTDYDIFPKEIAERFRANDQTVIEAGTCLELEEIAPHDEGIHTYNSIKFPLKDDKGVVYGVCGISTDISDRKKAEEERAKLIDILEATSDIIGTVALNGQVTYLNSSARKILGFDRNEDLGTFTIPDAYPDWAYEILQTEAIPAAIGNGFWLGETAFLSHDKREIPVSQLIVAHKSPDGRVKYLSTIARDITQQKQIAATLLETERRWRSLLENVRLVVVGLDLNGKVDYVNPFFLELSEYTEGEVLGKDWFENFLPPHQKKRVESCFQELLEQEFRNHYQNSILTKSGEERVISWNNTLLQNLQGEAIGTLSIGEDITERQVIEQMKDEFVSIVSHELRTPLTSIHGALNLLSSGLVNPQSDKGRRVIEIAADSTERLVRLVNDILELERLESGKISLFKQLCNVSELMSQAVDMMQVMANRAQINLIVSPQNIELEVDSDRILQVLTNLVSNAIKFSTKGSQVWLNVELLAKELLTNSETTVLFCVKDTGRGIPPEKMESIFERFHQVDASDSRQKGGTGLGLAICRSIVQQHGGRIWVESTLGEGSSFYFALPRRQVEEKIHDNQAHLGN
ncbi:hypothetical protein NUACC21_71610 [Scytonema sp. NUACC21]